MSKKTQAEIEVGTAVAERSNGAVANGIPNVEGLMEMALTQGEGGVAALERLVELQERVMTRQAENALSDALATFQAECPQIRQSATAKIATKGGSSYSFSYAPLDEITRTIREPLQRNGLSYSWDSELTGNTLVCTCTVRHRDGASVASTFACPTESPSRTSEAQKTGAALTYAKRQSLVAALGLTTTSADEDALQSAPTGSVEPVEAEELTELRAMISDSGADIDRFLRFFEIATLDELPGNRLAEARKLLRAKAAR